MDTSELHFAPEPGSMGLDLADGHLDSMDWTAWTGWSCRRVAPCSAWLRSAPRPPASSPRTSSMVTVTTCNSTGIPACSSWSAGPGREGLEVGEIWHCQPGPTSVWS